MTYDIAPSEFPEPKKTIADFPTVPDGIYCERCTAPLAGEPIVGACPTCNKPVEESLPFDLRPAPTADMPEDEDLLCVNCTYNLRGLDAERNCPECGTPVLRSLKGDKLAYGALSYLKTLERGGRVIVFTTIAGYVVLALIIASVIIVQVNSSSSRTSDLMRISISMGLLMSLVTSAQLFGWWIFSTPDPSDVHGLDPRSARGILRIALICQIPALAFDIALGLLWVGGLGAGQGAAANVASGLQLIAVIAAYVAGALYVRALARRMPDESIASYAKTLSWAGPIVMVVLSICVGLGILLADILMIIAIQKVRARLLEFIEQQPTRLQELYPTQSYQS